MPAGDLGTWPFIVETGKVHNKFSVLATEINASTLKTEGTKKKVRKIEARTLRKVTVKIMLERIDT